MVYLPMCYVYGVRGTGAATPLTASLRGELFCEPYERIDWNAARSACAKEDLYYPHPALQARARSNTFEPPPRAVFEQPGRLRRTRCGGRCTTSASRCCRVARCGARRCAT